MNMTSPPLRVCVTGPESTGKTTLAMRLAEELHGVWVPEASRSYAEQKGEALALADVEPIACATMARADDGLRRALSHGSSLLVLDTDLLSTLVYSRHYYDVVPAMVQREARERVADLYLLCDIDVPWVPDGVRDQPTQRDELLARFKDALAGLGVSPVVVRGAWDVRWTVASEAVRAAQDDAAARRIAHASGILP